MTIDNAIRDGVRWLSCLAEAPPRDESASFQLAFGLTIAGADGARERIEALLESAGNGNAGRSLMALTVAEATLADGALRQSFARFTGDTAAGEPFWLPFLEDATLPYVAPAGLVRTIANGVFAATLCGRQPLAFGSASVIRDLLSFRTFCCLRQEDLDLLCPLVRASKCLGDVNADAVGFILDHQRDDGRFSSQELAIRRHRDADPEFDPTYDVYLPLTVASLWTLTSLQ